jgi:hypothetical protein
MLRITPSARVPAVSRRDFIGRRVAVWRWRGLARWSLACRWRRAVRPSNGLAPDACPACALPAAPGAVCDSDVFDTVEVPSQRGECYRGGFRNSFFPSCHAANCALMSSWAAASDL